MPITDDQITATSQITVTGGAGGPVFADFVPGAGKAYVMGKLGLGAINPQNALDVEGAVAVGAGYSGSFAAPLNGLAVEGSVGVGTNSPGAKLDVVGTMRVSQDAKLLGNVGIGTSIPGAKLDVVGTMRVSQDAQLLGKVGIGTSSPAARLQIAGGALMPSSGNTTSAGILFPPNPGGGGGDAAWMRYYARTGESTTLEIGVSNDLDDHIALMASGNVGIGTTAPAAKLDVAGTMRVSQDAQLLGRLRVDGNVGLGTPSPSTRLHVAGTSPALRIADGTQGDGKVLVSDAAGNAAWRNNSSRYSSVSPPTNAITAMNAPQKIVDCLTFTKASAASAVEVHLNTRVNLQAQGLAFAGSTVTFHLRIDDALSTTANVAVVTMGPMQEFISIFAVFQSLTAGTHVVSVWAHTNSAGFMTRVSLNPDSGGKLIVKETF